MILPENFENKLGFDRIREMLKNYCLCNLGRNEVENMTFSNDFETISSEHLVTEDMRKILQLEDKFPQDNYIDASPYLTKIEVMGSYPEVEELHDLRKSQQTIGNISKFFSKTEIQEKYSSVSDEFKHLKILPGVIQKIDTILSEEGLVRDNASPELKELRTTLKQKHVAVTRKINAILKSARQEGIVDSDAELTLRNGRPVIPVAANYKRRIGGLVQDESATGKTVYIEPHAVVELNNELRELEYAERREIIRILIRFADFVRPHLQDLLDLYQQLGRIDFLRAKAKLALYINGVHTILQQSEQMEWKNAVHPLLYLSHKKLDKEVIPLNIQLNADNRILLISGPNAGGKSVCLKTVGLLQYMLQCGLLIPMSENSETRIFDQIFIDIGDEQSLENDLSTYSSHLLNMKHFLKASNSNTLILIDEFGTGTEPALGGAIAEAILEKFNQLMVFGIITTHYANLKHFASETQGIINGAMLFDTQKIMPLYTLSIGEPGSSFAIDIARSIGLPESILQGATDKIGEDHINIEKHLREILRDKKYWDEKRKRIRNVEKTLDHLYENYHHELEDLQRERKIILSRAKKEAEDILLNANKAVERTIREIKENNAEKEKTRKAREKLDTYKTHFTNEKKSPDKFEKKQKELKKAGEKLAKYSPEIQKALVNKGSVIKKEKFYLCIGDHVKMRGFDTVGEIIDIQGKNYVVAIGGMITTLKQDMIEKADTSPDQHVKKRKAIISTNFDERRKKFKPEIDVRGKRADEALKVITDFMDDATLVSVKQVKILHGKGNGILRQLIRDYLKTLEVVKNISDAHADAGGAGITIVELK